MANRSRDHAAFLDLCACLKGRIPPSTDWEGVLSLANRTLVTPALAGALRGQEARVPPEAAGMLHVIAERTEARNRMMHGQLTEAVAALAAQGIVPVLLKGAALLARRGPECDDRLLTDLDLMVREDEGARALAALEAIGYRRLDGPTETSQGQGANLGRERDVGGLDLHYRLKRIGRGRNLQWLVDACSPFAIGTGTAAMPSPAALTALFVLHDQLQEADYWRGRIDLRHLVDMARLAEEEGGLDGGELAALFPPGRARRALAVQLDTLAAWLGVRVTIGERGWRVAFQRWRRDLQLRRPGLETALTLASCLADPPLGLFEHSGFSARSREIRRILLEQKATKV